MTPTVYTYTTEDDEGTKTYAFFTEDERDKNAFQWILQTLTDYEKDHAPYIGLSITDAYDLFQDQSRGIASYLWWDDHNPQPKTPLEADIRPVESKTEDLEGKPCSKVEKAVRALNDDYKSEDWKGVRAWASWIEYFASQKLRT